jgi:hypothetical protein
VVWKGLPLQEDHFCGPFGPRCRPNGPQKIILRGPDGPRAPRLQLRRDELTVSRYALKALFGRFVRTRLFWQPRLCEDRDCEQRFIHTAGELGETARSICYQINQRKKGRHHAACTLATRSASGMPARYGAHCRCIRLGGACADRPAGGDWLRVYLSILPTNICITPASSHPI